MEDFKLILYILAIVAYFIYTSWRKAFKTPDEEKKPRTPVERPVPDRSARERLPRERPTPLPIPATTSQPRQQRPSAPATSFEDILREMQSKMERANEQNKAPVEQPRPVLQPTLQPTFRTEEPRRVLSLENPEQARAYEQERRGRLATAEAVRQAKKQNRQPVPNRYAELLNNPESVRQAFIMSEIFNRKQY